MKIAILGAAGGIGQSLSLLLKIKLPKGVRITLYDTSSTVHGVTMDLAHIPTETRVEGFSGSDLVKALYDADIVLISAGIARKPGMSRSDLFNTNADIIYTLVEQVARTAPRALIGIITNPVNSTVVVASGALKKYHAYDKNRLFGINTLDTTRAEVFLSEFQGNRLSNPNVLIIGGHSSTTMLPLLSSLDHSLNKQQISHFTQRLQGAGAKVVEAKAGQGSATLSMGYAAARFCLSLVAGLQGKPNVVESAYVEGDGTYTRFFSQQVLLGKNGVSKYIPIGSLDPVEELSLAKIIKILNEDIAQGDAFISSR